MIPATGRSEAATALTFYPPFSRAIFTSFEQAPAAASGAAAAKPSSLQAARIATPVRKPPARARVRNYFCPRYPRRHHVAESPDDVIQFQAFAR
jgi:hypothetical protein